jgi:hypothetical protein
MKILFTFLPVTGSFFPYYFVRKFISIQADGYEGADTSKPIPSSYTSPLPKMCVYIFYCYKRSHQDSLRERREWDYVLTEPCIARPGEGKYCGQRTHHCIYLPFPCPECGGLKIPDPDHPNWKSRKTSSGTFKTGRFK